jgi:octaprenyl-diphosphate synthase
MDIAWHRDFASLPSLEDYDRMCRLKTGCLARLAAVLGAYCGCSGAGVEAAAQRYGEAAESLGVGFQILDDVKNLTTGIPGKKRGDDVVEGKKSLPVLLYLHRRPEKREFVVRCFTAARSAGTGAPQIEEFIGALADAGVLEEARKQGLELIADSRACFSGQGFADFFDLIDNPAQAAGACTLRSESVRGKPL